MRAMVAAGLWLAATGAALAGSDTYVFSAKYVEPTTRYAHGVLGDAVEWGALSLTIDGCPQSAQACPRTVTYRLPEDRVFEDIAPRLVDVDGDGFDEVVVIETQVNRGASLAVYGAQGKLAATPHIGTSNRWLAPVGAADLDGDGRVELAYVDRPHLAKVLRVWRWQGGKLRHVADLPGVTNHRIGEDYISGGIRTCGGAAEMIVADASWQRLVAVTLNGNKLSGTDIGPHKGRGSFRKALGC
jgi:hypothetical protein